jgi:hypothetical protein
MDLDIQVDIQVDIGVPPTFEKFFDPTPLVIRRYSMRKIFTYKVIDVILPGT